MARFRVLVKETVYYSVTVEADTEKKARKRALSLHEDGVTSEVDSTAGKVVSVETL